MQRLAPNSIIYDRFLLKEELSFERQTGQQTWAVQDRQTGQALIARLHADGRVEWFNDNRPPVSPTVAPSVPAAKKAPIPAPAPIQPRTVLSSKHLLIFLLIVSLLGGGAGAYVYRVPLLSHYQSWLSGSSVSPDGTSISEQPDASSPAWNSATQRPEELISIAPAAPVTAKQALRMLNQLKQIPAVKHAAIFSDARQAFVVLRQSADRPAYIDSVYTVCMGRGAQSYLLHEQNGDALSKQYAIDWYQLAYALKPTPALQERLNRLKITPVNRRVKRNKPVKEARNEFFMADPEVN